MAGRGKHYPHLPMDVVVPVRSVDVWRALLDPVSYVEGNGIVLERAKTQLVTMFGRLDADVQVTDMRVPPNAARPGYALRTG
jgi:hypothetical protein